MKKLLTLFAVGVMGLSLVGCGSGDSGEESGTLRVASQEMNGDFIEGFGNSSYDLEVKNLLHNYYTTYDTDAEGAFVWNQSILKEEPSTEVDEAGNKTYTFKLAEDLKWSDGSDMTADDFIFNLLLIASDEWVAQLAADSTGDALLGYEKYHKGLATEEEGGINNIVYKQETDPDLRAANEAENGTVYDDEGYELDSNGKRIPVTGYLEDENGLPAVDADGNFIPVLTEAEGKNGVFQGVKKIDDYTFSLTIDASQLPYFYEESYVALYPKPMKHLAGEDAEIVSSDAGCELVGVDLSEIAPQIKSGYRKNPDVVSGPYKLVSFKNKQVKLTLNEYFKGDYKGDKPVIENILIKTVNATTDMDQLIAGEVDVLTGVVEGEKIEKARATDSLKEQTYDRDGYGNMPIHNDFGPTKDPAVRRALNYVLEKDEVIKNVLGGYGSTVYADYGVAQWMYQENKARVEEELNHYDYSIANANAELDATEWKYEADGVTPFDASKAENATDYFRHNANGEVLQINHLGTEDNTVTDAIETSMMKNCPKAGIKFTIERTDFAGLLENYYNGAAKPDSQRKYHTFNMATGFTPVYDPYYSSYYSGFSGTSLNATNTEDEVLDDLMMKMRSLDPSQKDEYSELWFQFQKRFNEIVPVIPVYANQYFDFYNAKLKGFNTGPMASWSEIVCDLSWEE